MDEKLIVSKPPKALSYPEGSILFDVRYYQKPETFEVIFWNPVTNKLELKYEQPIIDIWFLKKDKRINEHQVTQVPIDDCYPFYCKPSQVAKVIAQEIGGDWAQTFTDISGNPMTGQYEINSKMCECPWVFKADFEPSVYFRLRWLNQYGTDVDISKVQPAFLDIETDVIDRTIDPHDYTTAPQPINAVTLILPEHKIGAVFVLGPRPKNLLDAQFHELLEMQTKEYNWLVQNQEQFKHDLVYADEDNVKYVDDFDIRIHIFDFDKEIYMIKTIFDYIAKYRPWFLLAWNAPFDFNYIWNRIKYLGYDPKEIMIPPEFKTDRIRFHEDKDKKAVIKTSRDWFELSTYPIMLCQMRNFAAIRKSQQERRSYKLTVIGQEVAHVGKSEKFDRELAYRRFLDFIKYNFRDVVVQMAIEKATGDCGSLFARSYKFATGYSKCFQETHIVRNIREYYYEKNSHVVQSCRLIPDKSEDGAFRGAFVADPEKNAPTGLVLNGKKVHNIIYGALDADAASYYPSTKMGMNLDPMTLLYKCKINNNVFQSGTCINRSMNQTYNWPDSSNNLHAEDLTGPIFNSFKNQNYLSIMNTWLGVPTITEVIRYLDEKLGYLGG